MIYDIINLPLITNFIILQQLNIAVFKYDDVKKNGTSHSSYMLLTTKHSTAHTHQTNIAIVMLKFLHKCLFPITIATQILITLYIYDSYTLRVPTIQRFHFHISTDI